MLAHTDTDTDKSVTGIRICIHSWYQSDPSRGGEGRGIPQSKVGLMC